MPRKRAVARAPTRVKRRYPARKRVVRRTPAKKKVAVKTAAGFFPKTTLVTCKLATELIPNSVAGQGVIPIALNALWRPLLAADCAAGVGTMQNTAPYTFVTASSEGTGLLSSIGFGGAYSQYRVEEVGLKVEFINNTTKPLKYVGYLEPPVINTGTASPPTFLSGAGDPDQQRYHTDQMIPADTSQGKYTVFHKKWKMTSAFGRTKAQIMADWGDGSAADSIAVGVGGIGTGTWLAENPHYLAWWNSRVRNLDGVALSAKDFYYRLVITWKVRMFNRNYIYQTYSPIVTQPEEKKDDDEPVLIEPPKKGPPSAAAVPTGIVGQARPTARR